VLIRYVVAIEEDTIPLCVERREVWPLYVNQLNANLLAVQVRTSLTTCLQHKETHEFTEAYG